MMRRLGLLMQWRMGYALPPALVHALERGRNRFAALLLAGALKAAHACSAARAAVARAGCRMRHLEQVAAASQRL